MILEIWLYNIDISAQRPNQASCSWFVSTPIKSRFFNSKYSFKKSIGVGIWYIFIFVCVTLKCTAFKIPSSRVHQIFLSIKGSSSRIDLHHHLQGSVKPFF